MYAFNVDFFHAFMSCKNNEREEKIEWEET